MSKGGGTTVNVPGPTAEQIELQRMELEMLRKQQQEEAMLAPLLYEKMGYKYTPVGEVNPDWVAINQKIEAIKNNPSLILAGSAVELQQLQNQLASTPQYLQNARIEKMTDEEYYNTLSEMEKAQYDINKALAERQQLALQGKLPVSPQALAEWDAKETELRNKLSAHMGDMYDQSEAWKNFQTAKANFIEEAQRGQISTGEQLMLAGTGAFNQALANASTQPLSIAGRSAGTVGLMNNAINQYNAQRQMELQAALANAQSKAQSAAGFGSLLGSLIGAGGMIGAAALAPSTGGASLMGYGLLSGLGGGGGFTNGPYFSVNPSLYR